MTEIVAIAACTVLTLAFLFIVWDLCRRDNKNNGKKSSKAKSKKSVTVAQAVDKDWKKVADSWKH